MIKFGTSGWRGIIGEDFTFDNVRIASQGIANYLRKSGQKGSGVVVAYDTRFLSEKFALEAARILAFNDIQAYLCTRDVPTPVASFETVRRKAMGAINFTASHNPPEYNGLKFSTSNGAPALPEITKQIEDEINKVAATGQRVDVEEKHAQVLIGQGLAEAVPGNPLDDVINKQVTGLVEGMTRGLDSAIQDALKRFKEAQEGARRHAVPLLFRLAVGLVALLLVQMGIGELQYRTHLPWWLVLVHVAVAAAVWGWTVVLAALLRRAAPA